MRKLKKKKVQNKSTIHLTATYVWHYTWCAEMRINIISSTKDVEKSALTFPIGTLQYNLIKFYRTEMQIQRE